MVADNNVTLRRIYDGALVALARRGVHKLTMSDICNASGVARGTLYRYFKTKEDVLTAIAEHVERGLLAALVAAVERRPDIDERVSTVVSTILTYGQVHPETAQVIAAEPAFAMEFIRSVFPKFVAASEDLLAPALESARAVQSGAMSTGEMAELILRIAATAFFIPPSDTEEFQKAIAHLAGLSGRTAVAR